MVLCAGMLLHASSSDDDQGRVRWSSAAAHDTLSIELLEPTPGNWPAYCVDERGFADVPVIFVVRGAGGELGKNMSLSLWVTAKSTAGYSLRWTKNCCLESAQGRLCIGPRACPCYPRNTRWSFRFTVSVDRKCKLSLVRLISSSTMSTSVGQNKRMHFTLA